MRPPSNSAASIDARRIELLEARRLLSSTLGPDGTLTVVGTDADDVISLAPNADQLEVFEGGVLADSFANADVQALFILLRGGNDSLRVSNGLAQPADIQGGSGNDTMLGGGGRDSIDGEAGDDRMDGGKRNDTLIGGDGNDTFAVTSTVADGNDRFTGGEGDDTVDYSKRSTPIRINDNLADIASGDEHDSLADVVETIIGSAGNDFIDLTLPPSNDSDLPTVLIGGRGNDQLYLTPFTHNISIFGGDGDDVMSDGALNDLPNEANFFGDAGNDVIQASSYPCVRIIHGGAGIDTADYTQSVGGATLSLNNVADDFTPSRFLDFTLFGNIFDDVENLVGTGNGQNNLTGSDADNVLTTFGAAPSSIQGLGGNDLITGTGPRPDTGTGNGSDTVDGGSGIDAVESDPGDTIINIESFFALPAAGTQTKAITRARPPAAGSRLVGKKLIVYGSIGDDIIRISQTSQGMSVSINADTKVYPTASVKTISLNAQAGNDRVFMFKRTGTGRVTRQSAIYGGDGNDTLQSGDAVMLPSGNLSGGHALFGGRGNDLLIGGNGRDYLDGGDQAAAAGSNADIDDGIDTLMGGLGNDIVELKARNANTSIRFNGSKSGNAAEDVMAEIENVFGGRGADDIFGDVGANVINGGLGNDTIRGGFGLDRIDPSAGQDVVFVNDDTSYDFVDLNDSDTDQCFCDEAVDAVGRDNLDELNPP